VLKFSIEPEHLPTGQDENEDEGGGSGQSCFLVYLVFLLPSLCFFLYCLGLGADLEQAGCKHGEVSIVHCIARWLVQLQLLISPYVVMQGTTSYTIITTTTITYHA
jgi:hypothetical protein